MRKNEHEERLFKMEDERFEVDMIIDSTRTTVACLEKLAAEIKVRGRRRGKALRAKRGVALL